MSNFETINLTELIEEVDPKALEKLEENKTKTFHRINPLTGEKIYWEKQPNE